MRLFIAVNFPETVKAYIREAADRLRRGAAEGRFAGPESAHLTLAFLGDVAPSRIKDIKASMDAAAGEHFALTLAGAGAFRRSGGDIWWIGVEKAPALAALQTRLAQALESAGFPPEERAFRPHVTLARRVVLRPDFDGEAFRRSVGSAVCAVDEIALMRSDLRPEGPLYTKLYGRELL